MAVKTWISVVAGDAGTAGNWAPVGVPLNGDDIIIPAGTGAITAFTGITTAAVNIRIVSFLVEEGYLNNIGSAGVPAVWSIDRLEYRGTGASWWSEADTGGVTDEIIVESKRALSETDPAVTISGGGETRVLVNTGKVSIGSGVTMTDLETSPVSGADSEAQVTVACAVPNIYMNGGIVRATGNLSVTTGNVTIVGAGTLNIPSGANTIGHLNILGGRCVHNSSGTMTLVNLMRSGILDCSSQVDLGSSSAVAKTITTLRWMRTASFIRDTRLITITNSAFPYVANEGLYMGLRGGR